MLAKTVLLGMGLGFSSRPPNNNQSDVELPNHGHTDDTSSNSSSLEHVEEETL